MPPVLVALQQIFVTPELNEKIFLLLEEKISNNKKKTGRPGMDLWHILVLAIIRHALSTNWDRMEYLSNNDKTLRKIMGIHVEKFGMEEIEFPYQTIADNVSLIDEEMLHKINDIVVAYGQKLFKKKDEAVVLQLKTDSFVAETNIHFPTDLNLLYDSLRKGVETIAHLCKQDKTIKGWRKHKAILSDVKSLFRVASHKVFRGKNEAEKKQSVKNYLNKARAINKKLIAVKNINASLLTAMTLQQYSDYTSKFIDQIERRLLKGEVIPADEKIFSIFEPHTEWISKGKLNKKVELGHLVLITTDQNSFIVDYKVMEKPTVVLPKRGRHTAEDKERESEPGYKKISRKHSAVESNINMLEHHGLNRCRDKGLEHYKKYVGLSVLAYNLHQLGKKIITQQKKEEEKNLKRKAGPLKMAA